ncbi:oligopeptide:H+ symporter [Streptomyces kronopolitis]|uniref:peptide MFS transporter n=1 Tax=Streptomyces kronopolitis TaxID=1612435 RepID=UPI003413E418
MSSPPATPPTTPFPVPAARADPVGSAQDASVPGGGRGFSTLFAVDLWERFSFYGMASILVLYLTATPADGGLGMAPQTGTAVFAAYMALNFMAGLPGGWLADRVLGTRRSVLLGGTLIAAGHVVLAVPMVPALYGGLLLVVAGTGLVKPAVAALVAAVSGSGRREAAFSVFYMSIQVSALTAPLVTGALAERVAWHLGFVAAAVGMALGLVFFTLGLRRFGTTGRHPEHPLPPGGARPVLLRTSWTCAAVAVLAVTAVAAGLRRVEPVLLVIALVAVALPYAFLARLRRRAHLTVDKRRDLRAFTLLMTASAGFWMIFAQSGSVLGLFAAGHTRRSVLGFEVPASWFQAAHPLFVLMLAPLSARFLSRARDRLTVPAKFAVAITAAGVSYLVMAAAAAMAGRGEVSPLWLLAVYLLFSCGELTLAPVALALAAEVAPPGHTGQFLALNGLFGAVGVMFGGQLFRLTNVLALPTYFLLLGTLTVAVGFAVGLARGRLRVGPARRD